ncbi:MAG: DUF4383 domain-containing protein [Pseudonocardia sp.]
MALEPQTARHEGMARPTGPTTAVRLPHIAAAAVGGVLLLLGIAGLLVGSTGSSDGGFGAPMTFLGVLNTSPLANLVHIGAGVVGLVAARSAVRATWFLVLGGTGYLLFTAAEMLLSGDQANDQAVVYSSAEGLSQLDQLAPWVHFALGVVMGAIGILTLLRTSR